MFVDLAILIPLLPALGWLLITVFNRAMRPQVSAWLGTILMGLSALLAIGLFRDVITAAPQWDAGKLEQIYHAEHDNKGVVATSHDGELTPIVGETATSSHEGALEGEAGHVGETAAAEAAHGEESEAIHSLLEQALIRPPIGEFPVVREWPWLKLQDQEGFAFGFYFDQLSALMVLMVAVVAFFIHLFSVGYMAGEERYATFFAYINLFAAAMLAMVMSKNLFHVLLFWEIMGVMSYLLIGFFYKKKSAQQAQKKAFLTVRIGDLAFMAGLFWLYSSLGTLDIPTIIARGEAGSLVATLGVGAATGIGLLLFLAAVGKSAQFPLHVWLPDAMEGPTPVSAMIHAATMVAAGVYLVARAYPIMEIGPTLQIIAWIGGFTALFAATMAPAMADAKKIMAFSTLSQLGYMFLGLGVFGYTAALFHLLTHAFFKALLFLGSGSMIHGSGTQDIFEMNHLAKYQKWTLVTVWVGALSLMGFPLFAGFWSKDEILHAAQSNTPLYIVAVVTAVLTAFYTTRLMIIAFYKPAAKSPWQAAAWNQQGEPSLNMSKADVLLDAELESHSHGHADHHESEDSGHGHGVHGHGVHGGSHKPHESGPEMIIPLVVLAVLALAMGLLGSPITNYWLQRAIYFNEPEVIPFSASLTGYLISAAIVFVGAGAAFALYSGDHLRQRAPIWVTRILQRRYYIDDFYYALITRIAQAPTMIATVIDRQLIDRLVDFVGGFVAAGGDFLRRFQTGSVSLYAWFIVFGAAVITFAFAVAQRGAQ